MKGAEMRAKAARVAGAFVLAVTALMFVAVGSAAGSTRQACDPTYGCTSTSSAPPTTAVHCVAVFHGSVGGPQTADVSGLPPGADVSIVFNGKTYGTAVADQSGHATISFQLPTGHSGTYQIIADGADFSAACDPSVKAISAINNPGGSGSGSLAYTGLGVGLLVLAAVALVLAGALLRRRRRAA